MKADQARKQSERRDFKRKETEKKNKFIYPTNSATLKDTNAKSQKKNFPPF